MTETPSERGEARAGASRPPWRDAVVLVSVALGAVAGYVWSVGGFRRAHDRHQIRQEVRRIEAAIRSGSGIGFWIYVEGRDSGNTDAEEHARHTAILRDFERLARLDGMSFADLAVEVTGDDAVARFHVNGRSRAREPPPIRAELTFQLRPTGWLLVRSRLFER